MRGRCENQNTDKDPFSVSDSAKLTSGALNFDASLHTICSNPNKKHIIYAIIKLIDICAVRRTFISQSLTVNTLLGCFLPRLNRADERGFFCPKQNGHNHKHQKVLRELLGCQRGVAAEVSDKITHLPHEDSKHC